MIKRKLCIRCSNDPNAFKPGEVYSIVPQDECPRCRTKWIVRGALATWSMMCFGAAISLLFLVRLSYGIGETFDLQPEQCNAMWIVAFTLFMWVITSTIGRWVANRIGIIGGDIDD